MSDSGNGSGPQDRADAPVLRPPPPPSVWALPARIPQPFTNPTQATTNGFAITSMVLGILWLYGLGSLLAVVFGHVALSQIKQAKGWQRGRGMAIAGLALGYAGLAVVVAAIILTVVAVDSGNF